MTLAPKSEQFAIEREVSSSRLISASQGIVVTYGIVSETLAPKGEQLTSERVRESANVKTTDSPASMNARACHMHFRDHNRHATTQTNIP
jgi:hypothetical protein